MDKRFQDANLDDLKVNTEQFTKFTEIKYWLQLIEYDLTCTHECLVYLTYKIEKDFLKNENKKMTIIDRCTEFLFLFL
jgi:hypothetical protein